MPEEKPKSRVTNAKEVVADAEGHVEHDEFEGEDDHGLNEGSDLSSSGRLGLSANLKFAPESRSDLYDLKQSHTVAGERYKHTNNQNCHANLLEGRYVSTLNRSLKQGQYSNPYVFHPHNGAVTKVTEE